MPKPRPRPRTRGPTPRQAARKKELLEGLDGYLVRLRAFDKKSWDTLSVEEQKNVARWQHELDKIVLRLARRGVKHPYVTRRLSNLRVLGDKRFLRRAHLEAGVRRPIPPSDLMLWDTIDRLLQEGGSREAIRKALIAEGSWKGSRQAFDKLLVRLDIKAYLGSSSRRPRRPLK